MKLIPHRLRLLEYSLSSASMLAGSNTIGGHQVFFFCKSVGGHEGIMARQAIQRGLKVARSISAKNIDVCVVKSILGSDSRQSALQHTAQQAPTVLASRRTKRVAAAAVEAVAATTKFAISSVQVCRYLSKSTQFLFVRNSIRWFVT